MSAPIDVNQTRCCLAPIIPSAPRAASGQKVADDTSAGGICCCDLRRRRRRRRRLVFFCGGNRTATRTRDPVPRRPDPACWRPAGPQSIGCLSSFRASRGAAGSYQSFRRRGRLGERVKPTPTFCFGSCVGGRRTARQEAQHTLHPPQPHRQVGVVVVVKLGGKPKPAAGAIIIQTS